MIIMEFKMNEYHRDVSEEELINDLLRVSRQISKTYVSRKEYLDNGKYSATPYIKRYGSWVCALKAAGLSTNRNETDYKKIPDNALLKDIKNIAIKLNKESISTRDYTEHGIYSLQTIISRYGSWNNALKIAGLKTTLHKKVSNTELLEEIEKIWIAKGTQPTTTDIKNGLSKYSLHTFERRFGSWRKALEFFVSYINGEQEVEKPDEIESDVPDIPVLQQPTNKTETIHKTKRDINLRTRFLVMKRDNFKCCMCGRSPATTPGLELHIDHIKPWAKGGETVIDNLQTLCSECNLGKSDLY